MKRYIVGLLALFGIAVAYAGTPQESYFSGAAPLSNTTIVGSTATTAGTASLTVSLAPGIVNGNACRNCFTDFTIQIPTTSIVNVLDGATTSFVLYGAGLGTTGTNTRSITRDHIGPMCFTAGNTTTINLVGSAGGAAANPQVVNYEGYTNCGGTNNAGPMR